MNHYLAFDLGAESGRAMLGTIDGGLLHLEELHRFLNEPVRIPAGLFWDTFRLFHEIQRGLAVAGRERRLTLAGIGIDTWGVDFGLLDREGALLDSPRHYRDARNNGMLERTFSVLPKQEIYAATGIQFMQFNSLYQVYASRLSESPALDAAERLLFMPDLFSYWLSGVARAEMSIASTSQFYDPARKRWATELFDKLGLPARILAEVAPSGTRLGPLLPWVSQAAGLGAVPVYATCGHDTASAVAAVPAEGEDWVYISSGTWSLMGVELAAPVITDAALAMGFTNELGIGASVRFLKNITGLWLLQECRRDWALEGREFSYAALAEMAAAAPPFPAIIDPDAFLEPGALPARICEFCTRTGQHPPTDPGAMARVILESLALRYRQVLENLESLLGRRQRAIHIVGGGSKNPLLNQFVADATGRPVIAGPAEATAVGNVLVQAIGSGAVSDLAEARRMVARSFEVERFEPQGGREWDQAYARFRDLRESR